MAELRTAQQFVKIDAKRDELVRLKAGAPAAETKLQNYFYEEIIFHSFYNNPAVTRDDVRKALSGKNLKDAQTQTEISNFKKALDYTVESARANRDVSEELLTKTHALLADRLDPSAGRYREGAVKPILRGHAPADAAFIPNAVRNTMRWLSTASFTEIHPVEQAVLLLARLLEIQPFASANLKVAHLLSASVLLRREFPILILRKEDLPDLYLSLEKAFALAMQDLINFYAKILERSLDEALEITRAEG
jgi:Fic family protein